ncbi:hypothetical protein [Tortoise microvirus 77]|nr:hypothetical protein [Tortoise microvirus 77]
MQSVAKDSRENPGRNRISTSKIGGQTTGAPRKTTAAAPAKQSAPARKATPKAAPDPIRRATQAAPSRATLERQAGLPAQPARRSVPSHSSSESLSGSEGGETTLGRTARERLAQQAVQPPRAPDPVILAPTNPITPVNPVQEAARARRVHSLPGGTLRGTQNNTTRTVTAKAKPGDAKARTQVQPHKAARDDREPDKRLVCKARPESNKPKGGGGGAKRAFIPWCS